METTHKPVILLVDDKPANILALENLLGNDERYVISASTGEEALKVALQQDIDLIILDVQMPGMNGFEVAQVLKSNRRTKNIPIIFATAESRERREVMKGYDEGAVDYLVKPLDPEVVKAKVHVLLKIQMQQKELLDKNEEIRRLNTELQANVQQLQAANKELESFSYSVSHDLRAPLRIMSGYSSLLEQDYSKLLDEEGRKMIRNIQANAEKMGQLIDDLLAFSRLGRKEMQPTTVNMNAVVDLVLIELEQSLHHRAAIVKHPLPPVSGDYSLLQHVWANLISNAIKYSGKTTEPVIEIGASIQANESVYYVKDNGVGFNMQYVHKLFGVFQRLHHTRDFPGTGVGLAIVQRIISRHGGRVWAEGAINQGASFYFALPS